MKKAVIFDLDEVLIDSVESGVAFYKHTFKHFNIKLPKGKKQRLLYTLSGEGNYNAFFRTISKDEYFKYKKSINFNKYLKLIKISKNAKELLKFLVNKKYKTAIVTNRGRTTYLILKRFKIEKYFDIVLIDKDMKRTKPDPYSINLAVKKLKVKKSEVLYLGDDIVDIKAAKKAKVKIALYKNKFKGADYYINDLLKLKKYLVE